MIVSFRKSRGKFIGLYCASAMLLAGCQALPDISKIKLPPVPGRQKPAPSSPQTPNLPPPTPRTAATPESLDQIINARWRIFPGKTGVAVHRVGSDWTIGARLDDLFPQQSVSKTWVALSILDQIDNGILRMDQKVRVTREDFAVFHSPVRDRVMADGALDTDIRGLLEFSITESDNTANDKLLRLAGGPSAIRAFIAKHNLGAIRFGPGERLLQSGIAGLEWRQEYAIGNAFFEARDKIPLAKRREALNRYIADPVDGASPRAIVMALDKLASGSLLSPQSSQFMLGLMGRVKSGPQRLKAGVPAGWSFAHKTGTGQVLSPVATGYNDIGVMTAPDGTRYAVAVLLSDTTISIPERMEFMQFVSKAVGDFHNNK